MLIAFVILMVIIFVGMGLRRFAGGYRKLILKEAVTVSRKRATLLNGLGPFFWAQAKAATGSDHGDGFRLKITASGTSQNHHAL